MKSAKSLTVLAGRSPKAAIKEKLNKDVVYAIEHDDLPIYHSHHYQVQKDNVVA